MSANGEAQPTDREWADAPLTVTRCEFQTPDQTIFRLVKSITKHGRNYEQSVWLNVHQLRGVADHELGQ